MVIIYYQIFQKTSPANIILHASSAHPSPLVNSIPYGQYLQLKRNCMREEDFHMRSKDLLDWLLNRGYSKDLFSETGIYFTIKHKLLLVSFNKMLNYKYVLKDTGAYL